jgi:predicted permease
MARGGRRHLRVWGADPTAEVDEELSFHVAMLIEEYRAAGRSEEEARAEALRRFGDVAGVEQMCVAIGKETQRMRRRREWWSEVWHDVRFGVRQLRAQPLPAALAIVTLALGIGANTAMFSVVNGVVLRPLPYPSADRLYMGGMSLPDYEDLRAGSRSFEAMSAWASNLYTDRSAAVPVEVLGAQVSADFFAMMGGAALGRTLGAADMDGRVAVISHALWQSRFAGDRDVPGRTLELNDEAYDIIGVMPPLFEFPRADFDVYVPLDVGREQAENRSLRIFRVIGRTAPGVTAAMLDEEMGGLSEQLARTYPETNAGVQLAFAPLSDLIIGDVRPVLLVLLGVVGFVLLIACVNVANLQLSATAGRGRELAVRLALGAERWRIVRQLLTESAVLGAVGAATGVAVGWVLLRALPYVPVDLPRVAEARLDGSVLAFATLVALLTVLLFGIAPALQGSRATVSDVLKEHTRASVGARGGRMLRSVLVTLEVGLAVVVLVGTGLLVQSLVSVLRQDIGFEPDRLISANTGLFYFEDPAERVVRLEQALVRLEAIDGVTSVAAGSGLPPRTAQRGTGFVVSGRTPDETEQNGAFWLGVTPGYFATLGTRIIDGREFTTYDRAGGEPAAIISESLARALFGEAGARGRQLRLTNAEAGSEWRTIVGVATDIRYQGVENPAVMAIYTPFAQTPFNWAYLMLRSSEPAPRLAPAVRSAVGRVDSRMIPARIEAQRDVVSDLIAQRRFLTLLFEAFAALALVLAAVGIYGVIAHAVAQKRREIGVRLALGARPRTIVVHVLARALAPTAIGAALGALAALWLSRLLATMLYQVEATSPIAFLGGTGIIALTALAAGSVPALRAARLQPVIAMRED